MEYARKDELALFKACLEHIENDEVKVATKLFFKKYEPIEFQGDMGRMFQKAQAGFVDEMKNISEKGLTHSAAWHKNELINYMSEMLAILE